jgi:hypothetical protein
MCSTPADGLARFGLENDSVRATNPAQRIAKVGQAIDELAADAHDTDVAVSRIAKLWDQLAELDPEIARRLATYKA